MNEETFLKWGQITVDWGPMIIMIMVVTLGLFMPDDPKSTNSDSQPEEEPVVKKITRKKRKGRKHR